jgi:predicted Zn finger-like uncharacterized protein
MDCPNCRTPFVYEDQPEIAMGAVRCHYCLVHVDQAGHNLGTISPAVRRVLGESAALDEVKPVVVKTRQEEYHVCPHCGQEIHEKHTFVEGYGTPGEIERHADCGGAIKFPPTDWSKISPEWRKLLGV